MKNKDPGADLRQRWRKQQARRLEAQCQLDLFADRAPEAERALEQLKAFCKPLASTTPKSCGLSGQGSRASRSRNLLQDTEVTTMPFDYSDAPIWDDELIPHETVAPVRMTVLAGNAGESGVCDSSSTGAIPGSAPGA